MNNSDKTILAFAVVIIVGICMYSTGKSVHANPAPGEQIGYVQHLYDNALELVGNGDRKGGCLELRRALIHSKDLEDDGKTYYNIRVIGTTVCNWVGATPTPLAKTNTVTIVLDTIHVTADK